MKPHESVDLLITNGTVLTMDEGNTVIPQGAVAVAADTIVALGPADGFDLGKATRVIDAGGGVIMPGLVNTHTHAAMTCFRGLADGLPLMNWLNDYIFPAEAKMDAQQVYLGTQLACAEMMLSGTTCFCDMYLYEGAVANAAKASGMRAVVGEVLYDFDSPNYGPIDAGFKYTQDLIDQWRDDPLITIAVEPHSPYLCAPELLQQANTIAQTNKVPLVIHVAETKNEVEQIQKKFGYTPVGFLDNIGVLSPRLLACHCVALSAEDIDLLRQHDVKVAHNPESNMKLASGIAPVPQLHEAGICVALGTDGCASNNNLDLWGEMETAAKLHKVNTLDPTVMDAATVLRMGTIDGARALGLDHLIGSLECSKKADIIVVDLQQPHLTPVYNPVSHLIYCAGGGDVDTTIINGRVVMQNRQLQTIEIEDTMEAINLIAATIRST